MHYFPNDVYLLAPLVHFIQSYDESDLALWKSHFTLLYWISILLLSPFDLSTIQSHSQNLGADVYNLAMLYISRYDIVGEQAAKLLARLLVR